MRRREGGGREEEGRRRRKRRRREKRRGGERDGRRAEGRRIHLPVMYAALLCASTPTEHGCGKCQPSHAAGTR